MESWICATTPFSVSFLSPLFKSIIRIAAVEKAEYISRNTTVVGKAN
jgi:hypothetical protein